MILKMLTVTLSDLTDVGIWLEWLESQTLVRGEMRKPSRVCCLQFGPFFLVNLIWLERIWQDCFLGLIKSVPTSG